MCLMGAHQQKNSHQHKLQQNVYIMYENLFSTTKIIFFDFHGVGPGLSKENGLLRKIPITCVAVIPPREKWHNRIWPSI